MSILNFFKKTKVENGADLEATVVALPKSKVEKSLATIINEYDAMQIGMPDQMANGDHKVKVGEEEMTVNALVEKHAAMCQELSELKAKNATPPSDEEDAAKKKAIEEEAKKNADEEKKKKDDEEAKKNADKDEEEKKKNEEKEAEEKKKNAAHFDTLKNAVTAADKAAAVKIDLSVDKVIRGQERYGSSK